MNASQYLFWAPLLLIFLVTVRAGLSLAYFVTIHRVGLFVSSSAAWLSVAFVLIGYRALITQQSDEQDWAIAFLIVTLFFSVSVLTWSCVSFWVFIRKHGVKASSRELQPREGFNV